MFVVEVGALLTTAYAIAEPFLGDQSTSAGRLAPSSKFGDADAPDAKQQTVDAVEMPLPYPLAAVTGQ